jgi:hypothetical protein
VPGSRTIDHHAVHARLKAPDERRRRIGLARREAGQQRLV